MNSAILRSLFSAAAGFVAYGSWAYWVNADHGSAVGLRAGLVQGSWSFSLTLVMTLAMEWLLTSLETTGIAALLTFLITILVLFAGSFGVNWLAGTPEILITILPGFAVGAVYSAGYIGLRRRAWRVAPKQVRAISGGKL